MCTVQVQGVSPGGGTVRALEWEHARGVPGDNGLSRVTREARFGVIWLA